MGDPTPAPSSPIQDLPVTSVEDDQPTPVDGLEGEALVDALKLRRAQMRLAPANGEAPVAQPMNFRMLAGTREVIPLADRQLPPGFDPMDDAEARIEEVLGRADINVALDLATQLMEGQPAPVEGATPTPQAVTAITIRVRALLLEGRVEEAEAALGAWEDRTELDLAAAFLALSRSGSQAAAPRLTRALARRPNGLAENYCMGLLKASTGEAREAIMLLSRVAAHMQEHAVARHLLGKLTAEEGDPARAGTLFEQAWELAPNFVAPALTLAEMFMDARQLGEAMNILNAASERAPALLAPRMMQLRILLEARRAPAAVPLAEALRQAAPQREDITLLWAETLLMADRGPEVRMVLEDLLERGEVQDRARVHNLLAKEALAAQPKDSQRARTHLEAALEDRPGQSDLYVELAQLQLGMQDNHAARKTLERFENLEELELTTVLSATLLATRNGMPDIGQRLSRLAMDHVRGTPMEVQVRAILEQA